MVSLFYFEFKSKFTDMEDARKRETRPPNRLIDTILQPIKMVPTTTSPTIITTTASINSIPGTSIFASITQPTQPMIIICRIRCVPTKYDVPITG